MSSGPVRESELRFDSKLSTLSGEKDTESKTAGCDWVRWVQKVMCLGPKIWKQTEFRHSAFSHSVGAVQPFEVREGMEGQHIPETDLTRCHHDLV